MKESFILHTDAWQAIEKLDLEQRGQLLTALYSYQMGKEPPEMDPVTEMAFTFMAGQLDRDNDKYDQIVEKRKAAAASRWADANASKSRTSNAHACHTDTVTDTGTVNGTDTGTVTGTVTDTENESPKGDSVVIGATRASTTKRATFKAPSLEEVWSYARERGSSADPDTFWDYYKAKGWMVGKTKMQDWKAAWRNWERREEKQPRGPETGKSWTEIAQEYNERMGGTT